MVSSVRPFVAPHLVVADSADLLRPDLGRRLLEDRLLTDDEILDAPRTLIVGPGGVGKTRYLRHLEAVLRDRPGGPRPRFVRLGDLGTTDVPDEVSGPATHLLDGFDESSLQAGDAFQRFAAWLGRQTSSRVVVTSRSEALSERLRALRFRPVGLLPFSRDQVDEYLRQAFEDGAPAWLQRALTDPLGSELARIPALLEVLCAPAAPIDDAGGRVGMLAAAYEQALREWWSERGLHGVGFDVADRVIGDLAVATQLRRSPAIPEDLPEQTAGRIVLPGTVTASDVACSVLSLPLFEALVWSRWRFHSEAVRLVAVARHVQTAAPRAVVHHLLAPAVAGRGRFLGPEAQRLAYLVLGIHRGWCALAEHLRDVEGGDYVAAVATPDDVNRSTVAEREHAFEVIVATHAREGLPMTAGPDDDPLTDASMHLRRLGHREAEARLGALLDHPTPRLRYDAVGILARLGRFGPLRKRGGEMLRRGHAMDVRAISAAVGAHPEELRTLVPAVRARWSSESDHLAQQSLVAAVSRAGTPEKDLPLLVEACRRDELVLGSHALRALSRLGPTDRIRAVRGILLEPPICHPRRPERVLGLLDGLPQSARGEHRAVMVDLLGRWDALLARDNLWEGALDVLRTGRADSVSRLLRVLSGGIKSVEATEALLLLVSEEPALLEPVTTWLVEARLREHDVLYLVRRLRPTGGEDWVRSTLASLAIEPERLDPPPPDPPRRDDGPTRWPEPDITEVLRFEHDEVALKWALDCRSDYEGASVGAAINGLSSAERRRLSEWLADELEERPPDGAIRRTGPNRYSTSTRPYPRAFRWAGQLGVVCSAAWVRSLVRADWASDGTDELVSAHLDAERLTWSDLDDALPTDLLEAEWANESAAVRALRLAADRQHHPGPWLERASSWLVRPRIEELVMLRHAALAFLGTAPPDRAAAPLLAVVRGGAPSTSREAALALCRLAAQAPGELAGAAEAERALAAYLNETGLRGRATDVEEVLAVLRGPAGREAILGLLREELSHPGPGAGFSEMGQAFDALARIAETDDEAFGAFERLCHDEAVFPDRRPTWRLQRVRDVRAAMALSTQAERSFDGIAPVLVALDDLRPSPAEPATAGDPTVEPSGYLSELVDALRERPDRVIPFVGAGISRDADFPTWAGLLREMAERAEISVDLADPARYPDAADEMREALGEVEYVRFLRRRFPDGFDGTVPPAAAALAEWPCTLFLTSNWDGVLAKALGGEASLLHWTQAAAAIDAWKHGRRALLRVHGDTSRLPATDRDKAGLVLTRSDYDYLRESRARHAREYREAMGILLAACTFVFVGFGLADPDLEALLAANARLWGTLHGPHYTVLPGDQGKRVTAAPGCLRHVPYDVGGDNHAELAALLRRVARAVAER